MKSLTLLLALSLTTLAAEAKELNTLNFKDNTGIKVQSVNMNQKIHMKVLRLIQHLPVQKTMIAGHWDNVREKMIKTKTPKKMI